MTGGAIYTNGGQGGGGSLSSVISGNVVAEAGSTATMIYPDEGSSYWDITDNVLRFGGASWVGMWTPTINNITVDDNYSDNSSYYDNGTDITLTQATIVTDGAWPAAAQAIIAAAGPSGQHTPVTGLDAYAATRSAQQVLYSVSGLTPGLHTLTLIKDSGIYLLVDRFDVG